MNVKRIGSTGKSMDNVTPSSKLNVKSFDCDIDPLMDWIKVNRIQLATLVIGLVSFVCFIPSLPNDFVFDDIPTIINNKDLRPDKSLYRIFFNDYWGTPINKEESHKSYRPLTILTFRLNYMVHGLQVTGYHLVNSILHSIVSALFFRVCLRFNLQFWESVLASIYFAIHPIHVDAVASIIGRAELLSATFSLSALLYYCHNQGNHHHADHHPHHPPPTHHHHHDNDCSNDNNSDKSILIVFILTLIGTFCKEQSSMTLIVCIYHDLLFKYELRWKILKYTDRWLHWIRCYINSRKLINDKQSNCSKVSPSSVPVTKSSCAFYANTLYLFMGFITITCLRLAIMNNKLPSFNRLDNPARTMYTPYRQLNYAYIWSYNYWLLLYPVNLSCDWSSSSIQLIVSLIDPKNIFTLTILTIFTLVLLRSDSVTWMGLGFMVITFLPCSNLFFPVGFVIAERVLYIPSMGFSMVLARGLILLHTSLIMKSKRWIRLTFHLMLVISALGLGVKTISRCYEWKNELTLFTSGLNVNPGNVKLLNNVGRLYEDQGNLALALSYYEKSVSIEPDDVRGYLNLGKALTRIGRLSEAEMFYRKALELIPGVSSPSPQGLINIKPSNDLPSNSDPSPLDKILSNSYISSSSSLSLSLSSLLSTSSPSLPSPLPSSASSSPTDDQQSLISPAERLNFPGYERLVNQGTNTDHNDYTLIDHNDNVNDGHQDDNLKESATTATTTTTTTTTTDNNLSSSITLNHLQGLLNYASLISRDESRIDEANRMFSTIASLRPDYSATYSTWIQSMIHTASHNNNHKDNDETLTTTTNGHLDNGQTILSQVTSNNKQTDPDILYNMAILFNNNGNLEMAFNLFNQALSIDPYHEETLLTSARIIKDNELNGDHLKVAVERLETLVSMGKTDETIYFDLGMLSIRSGAMSVARKYFAQAIELKPDFTEALFNMALLLYKEDQPQDALPFLKYLLQTEQTHGKALLLMLAINSSINDADDQSDSLNSQQLTSSSQPSVSSSL